MGTFVYLSKILYHFFLSFILYKIAVYCEKHTKSLAIVFNKRKIFNIRKKRSLHLFFIIVFCFLEGIYAIICGPQGVYIADRAFYAKRFSLDIFTPASSVGLYYIQSFLRELTDNPDVLFFVVGALYLLVTCIVYNKAQTDATVWILIGASQYLLFGCYQLKQALASAFVAMSIIFFQRDNKIFCFFCLVIAILFHEVAWVMVPIYFILYNEKSKIIKFVGYSALILSILGFNYMSNYAISIATGIIPGMSSQLALYVDSAQELIVDNNFMTICKGLPFYLITIEGIVYRRELKNIIPKYDACLFLSCFVSTMYFLSAFMYWMWRFGELVYLPVFIFASQLYQKSNNKNAKIVFYLIIVLLALFTYRKLFISYFTYGGLV